MMVADKGVVPFRLLMSFFNSFFFLHFLLLFPFVSSYSCTFIWTSSSMIVCPRCAGFFIVLVLYDFFKLSIFYLHIFCPLL